MATKKSLNRSLYDILQDRDYDPKPLEGFFNPTGRNKETNISDADSFFFTFKKDGKSYPASVAISDTNKLIVFGSQDLDNSPEAKSPDSDYDDSWKAFQIFLKNWQKGKGMAGFTPTNLDKIGHYMRKKKDTDSATSLQEGYYPLGKKASYSDSVPQVKILIQHTRHIEEGEQRYRNVARIFVENVNGERFLLPTKRPGVAKVYARHIAEGGTPYDERGKHITSLVEEYTQMAGFVRATKNGQFNESAQRLVNEGINHYGKLRETLSRMISQRGYQKYFDSYTPVLNEETDESTTINELFVQETLDPRIESVMPILARLSKNINEMSEVKELDEWAEKLVNETLEGADDIEEGKLAKAAMLGLAGMAALNPLAAKAGGVSLPGSGGAFNPDQQVQLNKSMEQQGAIEELQKFLAKQGLRQTISGELDNVTYDNIMKASQMHDAGKMSPDAAKVFQNLAGQAGLMKEENDMEEGKADIIKKIRKKFNRIEEGPADEPEIYDMGSDDKRFDDAEPYEDMSDSELMNICRQMGMEKMCVRDGEGGLANRDEVINALYMQDHDASLEEDLDANQKRVGQLGPTEPVGKNEKNLRGKLVGASESVENDDLNRIKEMIGYK